MPSEMPEFSLQAFDLSLHVVWLQQGQGEVLAENVADPFLCCATSRLEECPNLKLGLQLVKECLRKMVSVIETKIVLVAIEILRDMMNIVIKDEFLKSN
jgi:hypothetical protein